MDTQVSITVLYLHGGYVGDSWFSILLAVQHLLLWSKLHYFARAFSPTKSLLVDTIRVVIDDMKVGACMCACLHVCVWCACVC